MSKNIDNIVESVLHEPSHDQSEEFIRGVDVCRDLLKQSLTEKKLVVPMSYDTIYDILHRRKETHKAMLATGSTEKEIIHELTESIYERQFKGDE